MGKVMLVEAFHHRDLHWQSIKELKTAFKIPYRSVWKDTSVFIHMQSGHIFYHAILCVFQAIFMFYDLSVFIPLSREVQLRKAGVFWLVVCYVSVQFAPALYAIEVGFY